MGDIDEQMEKIISKKVQCKFSTMALGLLATRLTNTFASNPSKEQMEKCKNELSAFINKYRVIITEDLDVIAKL